MKPRKPMSQKQRFALSQAATANADRKRTARKQVDAPKPDAIPIRAIDANGLETPLPGAKSVRVVLDNQTIVEVSPGGFIEVRAVLGRRLVIHPQAANLILMEVERP